MSITDSKTCLIEQEMSSAGIETGDDGGHFNCYLLDMDMDTESANSSTDSPNSDKNSDSTSQNSLTTSTDPYCFSPPLYSYPYPTQTYQEQQHPQRTQQQNHHHNIKHRRQNDQEQHLHHHQHYQHQKLYEQQRQQQYKQQYQPQKRYQEQQHPIQQYQQQKQLQEQQQQLQHQQQQQQQQQRQQQQQTNCYNCAKEPEAEVMMFQSTKGLWDSLAYITSLSDMCDVIFFVGKSRHPVYGVKSLLSVRSRVMYLTILQAQKSTLASSKTCWKRLRHSTPHDVKPDGKIHVDVFDYDVNVFSQLIGFLHSGRVQVKADTVLGLYCAAAEYEVSDLRRACWDFVDRCAQRGQGHALLLAGRAYLERTCLDKVICQFLTD